MWIAKAGLQLYSDEAIDVQYFCAENKDDLWCIAETYFLGYGYTRKDLVHMVLFNIKVVKEVKNYE
jgi:hypothetical protein